MEVEEFIKKLKRNPENYLEVQTLEYIDHLLRGVLLTRGADSESSIEFLSKFYFFVAAWAGIEVYKCPWYQIIYSKTNSEEEAINVFYKLSDDFFKSYHNGN